MCRESILDNFMHMFYKRMRVVYMSVLILQDHHIMFICLGEEYLTYIYINPSLISDFNCIRKLYKTESISGYKI